MLQENTILFEKMKNFFKETLFYMLFWNYQNLLFINHLYKFKDKISLSKDIDFLEETLGDVCRSGYMLRNAHNKQEVVVVPKKTIKQGFFEKLFHLFR